MLTVRPKLKDSKWYARLLFLLASISMLPLLVGSLIGREPYPAPLGPLFAGVPASGEYAEYFIPEILLHRLDGSVEKASAAALFPWPYNNNLLNTAFPPDRSASVRADAAPDSLRSLALRDFYIQLPPSNQRQSSAKAEPVRSYLASRFPDLAKVEIRWHERRYSGQDNWRDELVNTYEITLSETNEAD